jgi:hypothetical protein
VVVSVRPEHEFRVCFKDGAVRTLGRWVSRVSWYVSRVSRVSWYVSRVSWWISRVSGRASGVTERGSCKCRIRRGEERKR